MSQEQHIAIRHAEALQREGRRDDAIRAYQALLARWPALPDGWFNLAYELRHDGQFDAALEAYERALAHGVRDPHEVHLNRAVIYSDELRRHDQAEHELTRALALAPDYPPALLNLGNLHEERGARAHAVECYRRLLATSARRAGVGPAGPGLDALARLAHLEPPESSDDALLQQLIACTRSPMDADPTTRANVFFALSRSLDRLGRHAEAFAAAGRANALAAEGGRPYDAARAERLTDQIIRTARPVATAAQGQPRAADAPAPVFICGMFRSGSTLLEQVLGSHSRVVPGGELNLLQRIAAGPLAPFPASLATLQDPQARALAASYLDELGRRFPEGRHPGHYVSDKRPDNFLLIGLIKRLFPDARIIHTVRHPLDTCVSVYLQHLDARVLPYSTDLDALAHHFLQYRRLMAHFQDCYGDSIIAFDYDRFVRDPRTELEPVLAFLGLDWEEDCLRFHERRNVVKTASYWQVRQPLYGDASGRWRHYARELEGLAGILSRGGVSLPG